MNPNETCRAMVDEAALLDRQGRAAEAVEAYKRLLRIWPDLPNSWYNLALLQRRMGEFPAALQSYREALERGVAQPEEVHLNRGVIFSDCLHRYEEAERELERALALNPAYLPALINLANLHEDLGRRDQALTVYERILQLAPADPMALARYAGIKSFSSIDDPLIGALRRALTQPGVTAADRANIEFALGRALDACGAYDAAFEAYAAGNRHSRESAGAGFRNYDPQAEERFIDRVIAAFPNRIGGEMPRKSSTPTSPRPIFVCGMFRSGSTLVEQLLAGHPRVVAGGELDFLPRAVQAHLTPFPESIASMAPRRLATLAADYLHMLHHIFPGTEYVTDKRPDNYLYIGLIKTLFPDAKIVHTIRSALDNCLSIYFLHLDPSVSYALDLMDIGRHYASYRRLMAHWKTLFGADILDLNYDELVARPEAVMKQLLAFLGLEWDERCLSVPPSGRAVKTASVWQVREPLYQRSSGRGGHYRRQLSALRDYLQSVN
jgi:hypothetical protein